MPRKGKIFDFMDKIRVAVIEALESDVSPGEIVGDMEFMKQAFINVMSVAPEEGFFQEVVESLKEMKFPDKKETEKAVAAYIG